MSDISKLWDIISYLNEDPMEKLKQIEVFLNKLLKFAVIIAEYITWAVKNPTEFKAIAGAILTLFFVGCGIWGYMYNR